jgi:hypothetical protein
MERDKENKRGHDKGLLALILFKWFKFCSWSEWVSLSCCTMTSRQSSKL